MSDIRFAFRLLAKRPVFSLAIAGLLAIGIGCNALIFSVVDAVLLRPLPVRDPAALVRMVSRLPMIGTVSEFSPRLYEALRDHSTTLSAVFGEATWDVALNQPGPSEQVRVNLPTPEYFQALGVSARYGRTLTPEDAKPNTGPAPAVLSYGFWRRRFHSDSRVVGTTIRLRDTTFVIVGITPQNFNGISVDTEPDIRVPLRAFKQLSGFEGPALDLAGRLKPGVALPQAQAECIAFWRNSFTNSPPSAFELRAEIALDPLERGTSVLRDRYSLTLKLLFASVGLLLLLVCANVAGLLLARGMSRRHEMAVRLAIGASRGRLIRQMLTESALITIVAAVGGVLIAWLLEKPLIGLLPPLRSLGTTRLSLSLDLGIDHRVLLFSIAISGLTALLFGLSPAVTISKTSFETILRSNRSSHSWPGRRLLVVCQIALCTMLLTGAALLVRTFEQLRSTGAGFDRDRVVTFTADPSLIGYSPQNELTLLKRLLKTVGELPGVESVGAASRGLMRGRGLGATIAPTGHTAGQSEFLNTSINLVTPDYVKTLGERIVDGRNLREMDASGGKPANVLVNEAFARRFFARDNPVGKRFGNVSGRTAANADFEIIGVVSDAKYRSLREPVPPTYFRLLNDSNMGMFVLYVRTQSAPESLIMPVRRVLAGVDSRLPIVEIHTLKEEVETSTEGERLTAALAVFFGGIAVIVTSVGIYGLLAYAVTSRRREIGIRMAVGASPFDVAFLFGRRALWMATGGVILGLGAALLVSPLERSLLYNVNPADPWSFSAAGFLVCGIAMAATAFPVLHAMRIEPASALREE